MCEAPCLDELRQTKAELRQAKTEIHNLQRKAERLETREGKREILDSICDAADGVTGTLLSGNEKNGIRHLTKSIMFATARPNKSGATRIKFAEITAAIGNVQRTDILIRKLIDMDLFIEDGSEPHEKDEAWLIIPRDIIKRLQNISSKFKRGHGSAY